MASAAGEKEAKRKEFETLFADKLKAQGVDIGHCADIKRAEYRVNLFKEEIVDPCNAERTMNSGITNEGPVKNFIKIAAMFAYAYLQDFPLEVKGGMFGGAHTLQTQAENILNTVINTSTTDNDKMETINATLEGIEKSGTLKKLIKKHAPSDNAKGLSKKASLTSKTPMRTAMVEMRGLGATSEKN